MWKFKTISSWDEIWSGAFQKRWVDILNKSTDKHVFFYPNLAKVWIETYKSGWSDGFTHVNSLVVHSSSVSATIKREVEKTGRCLIKILPSPSGPIDDRYIDVEPSKMMAA